MSLIDFLQRRFPAAQTGSCGEIRSIASHSRKVSKNSLFVALTGRKTDGRRFLKEAVQNGAGALLMEKPAIIPPGFKGPVWTADDARAALSLALNRLYDFPSRKLFAVAVTGTNGKTGVAFMLESLFFRQGWRPGLVSTVCQRCGEKTWAAPLTSPEPVRLFQRLKDFLDMGADSLIMEASSIGLRQKRLDGIDFNIAIFTNLSHDHLDYHKSREEYFQSKKRLFSDLLSPGKSLSLINQDDPFGRRLLKELKESESKGQSGPGAGGFSGGAALSFGEHPQTQTEEEPDFSFHIKKRSLSQTLFTFYARNSGQKRDIALPLPGDYNVSNATAAMAAAVTAGFPLNKCGEILENFCNAPGRMERVTGNQAPFQVFVDYAHTPDALQTVLGGIKHGSRNKTRKTRLVTVFGCGGERDRKKRPLMMRAALRFSDRVILTSDNPRMEPKEQIIKDCLAGTRPPASRAAGKTPEGRPADGAGSFEAAKMETRLQKSAGGDKPEPPAPVSVIWDRKEAIQEAIASARPGDIVLIAGKGHEKIQITGEERRPFSDKEIAREFLARYS